MSGRTGRLLALALLLALVAAAPAAANGTLTVSKSPIASAGTVTGTRVNAGIDDPGGPLQVINCGSTCAAQLFDYETCIIKPTGDEFCSMHNQVVTLLQTPGSGWSFAGWSGACTGTGECKPVMSSNRAVTANYNDTGAPSVAFSGPTQDSRFRTGIDVGATAGDNWGVAKVDFLLDGAVVATDTSAPYAATIDLSGKPDGDHITVAARATDNANLQSTLSSRTYFVDKSVGVQFTAPTPGEGSWVTSGTPKIGWVSDADVAQTRCRTAKNGVAGGWGTCTSQYTPPTSDDATYAVDVEVTDDVGNVATITRTFKVDRTPPAVSITTPANGSWRNSGFTPGFTAPGATATCAVDGGGYGACGAVGLLADGAHTLHVKAVDTAGNTTIADSDFNVDTVAPVVSFTGGTPQGAILDEGLASFEWDAGDGAPITITCALDDGPAGACDAGDKQAYSGLADGPHTFKLDVTDAAGNTTHRTRGFTVNAEKPSVAITDGPQENAAVPTGDVTFAFAAKGAVEVTCSLDSPTTFRACSGNGVDALHGIADGAHVFRVRVRDEADEVATAARTFRVDSSAPDTLIDAGPANGGSLSAGAVTFAFHSTAPGSSFRCRFGREGAVGAFGPCSGPGATHAAGGLAPGRYVFEVQAVNALGTADASPAHVAFTLVEPPTPFTVVNTWAWSPTKTMVRSLVVKRLAPGAKVSVTCKGKGCFKGTKQGKVANGKAKLTKLFRKRQLGAKARIDIAVTVPGADGHVVRFTTRKGAIPKRTDLCLKAGASKPGPC